MTEGQHDIRSRDLDGRRYSRYISIHLAVESGTSGQQRWRFGVSKGWSPEEQQEIALPHDALTVHVRGIAYKGTIETRTKHAESGAGPGTAWAIE